MIYTSRFQNPELKSGNYTVVGIVRGVPRFKLGYERAGNIIDIAPTREIFHINDREEFTKPYINHLEEVGFEKISEQIKKYVEFGKDVVLCCYEDVRIPNEWCHRLLFAEWWKSKTGEHIAELPDYSPIKTKSKAVVVANCEENSVKKPIVSNEEKILIKISYSLWTPAGKSYYLGGDVYYEVDRTTGKTKRMFDKEARELIAEGKAEVWLDYDSVDKIKFVLSKDSVIKCYRVNKSGQEKDITFKDAIKLAANGMVNIADIVTE